MSPRHFVPGWDAIRTNTPLGAGVPTTCSPSVTGPPPRYTTSPPICTVVQELGEVPGSGPVFGTCASSTSIIDAKALKFVVIGILCLETSSVSNCKDSFAPLPFLAMTTSSTRPTALEPARILAPEGSRTSCMSRAVTTCPGLLFLEFREEFNWSGNIVPGGIALCPNNPVASVNKLSRNVVLAFFGVLRASCFPCVAEPLFHLWSSRFLQSPEPMRPDLRQLCPVFPSSEDTNQRNEAETVSGSQRPQMAKLGRLA